MRISLVDRYLVKLMLPNIFLVVGIFSVFAELVGISFEQMSFLFNKELSLFSSIYIHVVKYPYFFSITIPFCLLFALLNTYQKLVKSSEFIALQSFGISKSKLIIPTLYICLLFFVISLILNCYIIPNLNYKAAVFFENEIGIHREKRVKEKIIYQEFTSQSNDSNRQYIDFIFSSDYFDGESMYGVSIMKFNKKKLNFLLTCESLSWNKIVASWECFKGVKSTFVSDNSYPAILRFEKKKLEFSKKPWLYTTNNLENREMNINSLYRKLDLIKNTGKRKKIRKLQLRINEKYTNSFSCITFGLVGCILGLSSNKTNSSQKIAFVFTFIYICMQMIISSLCISNYIPVILGIWIPNIISVFAGIILLNRS